MTTIYSAKEREIKDLILMRGGKPRGRRADKVILMEILKVDLLWLREEVEINGSTLITKLTRSRFASSQDGAEKELYWKIQ